MKVHPLEFLREAVRWTDPVASARLVVENLLILTGQDWSQGSEAARILRAARPDGPLLLAVTEPALSADPSRAADGLRRSLEALDDKTWMAELGLALAHHSSLGVTSLAEPVLGVLEAAARLGDSRAEIYTDRRAVARGLGYLGLTVEVAPPEEAEALLVPAVAAMGHIVWLRQREADTALAASVRGRRVVPVLHPLTRLSPLSEVVFRPPGDLADLRIEG